MYRTITSDELETILANHALWQRTDGKEGERANLRAADLRAANLRAADLRAANLRAANLSYANLSDANLSYANLRAASLRAANLRDADLRAANLRAANLSDADLRAANLRDADLRDANLRAANLRAANLSDADLSYANLRAANLSDADLSDADLSYADLSYANLRDANLTHAKEAILAVLTSYPNEVSGLLDSLKSGCIDGSMYSGQCVCLYGTIANLKGCDYHDLPINSSSVEERWFMAIRPGDTPENHTVAKITAEWIEEWLQAKQASKAISDVVARRGQRKSITPG